MKLRTPWIFDVGARVYDYITAQEIWRGHCRAMAPLAPGARVLDLGIGPGVSGIEMARTAPERLYVGVDLSMPMLEIARRRVRDAGVRLPLVRGDVARLPFPDGSFDAATAHSFLYLLPDSEAALEEIARVLVPGGRVAFMEPRETGRLDFVRAMSANVRFGTSMALWRIVSRLHGRFTEQTICEQLERCGFTETAARPTLEGLGLIATGKRA